MRNSSCLVRNALALLFSLLFFVFLDVPAAAQSQESKPTSASATPADVVPGERPRTGVLGASWQGPNWGAQASWDPDVWSVENEFIDDTYDGLQIGTEHSTVFIEAYEGFAGNAGECLADAGREIGQRDNVSESVPLTGRPLPDTGMIRGPSQLFGIVATLPDGATYRGVEYAECRTLVPDLVVLEITWQTTASQFNDELPLAGDVLSTIVVPNNE